jgi:hypothetical protein
VRVNDYHLLRVVKCPSLDAMRGSTEVYSTRDGDKVATLGR